jgi:predicted small metal-binding protein
MKLGCKDMGVQCGFVAEGKSADEVKKKLTSHAQKAHAELMKEMTKEDQASMVKKMDELLAKQR